MMPFGIEACFSLFAELNRVRLDAAKQVEVRKNNRIIYKMYIQFIIEFNKLKDSGHTN